MKCSVCQFGIRNERYVFCPMCGSNIQGDEFPFVKLNYLWERDRQGIFLYDNFKLIRETGLRALVKKPPVREKLGDWSSILMLGLRRYSLLQLNPDFNRELYTMSKLLGYFSGEIYLKVTHLDSIAKRLASTGLFWKVFEHKKLIDKYCLGWKNLCAAEIKLKDINRENHTLTYTLNEDANYFLKSEKPLCSVELGAISGHTEVFFDGFASGKETLCQSTKHKLNEFRIEYSQEEKEPILPETTKEEYSRVLDQAIDLTVRRKTNLRPTLGDYIYAGPDQLINYMLLHPSQGHNILAKHAGRIIGERIITKTGIKETEETLSYLKETFLYLKAGLLEYDKNEGSIRVSMRESVYSSGVNNIGMKLDTFLAGIIEGALNQATGGKWLVEETKCLANGNEYCEFRCRKIQ